MNGGGVDQVISRLVRDVLDFPQPGIVFKDIAPLLADGEGLATVIGALAAFGRDAAGCVVVDKVAGVEARGFVLAAPVAVALGLGFVPIRKQGKLPGATIIESYELEYGEATLQVQADAFAVGDRVLLIDDVLATGGTLAASRRLIERSGATVARAAVLIELDALGGRAALVAARGGVAGADLDALMHA